QADRSQAADDPALRFRHRRDREESDSTQRCDRAASQPAQRAAKRTAYPRKRLHGPEARDEPTRYLRTHFVHHADAGGTPTARIRPYTTPPPSCSDAGASRPRSAAFLSPFSPIPPPCISVRGGGCSPAASSVAART